MTAKKTWRLGFAESQGGAYIQLTEVAFLDADGVDLSIGGTASASSEYSGSYAASRAFDKSPSTDWCTVSGDFPAWVQYQHVLAVDVSKIRIVCSAGGAWLPTNVGALSLRGGDAQEDRYVLSMVSGSFVVGATVVLSAQPYVPPTLVGTHAVGSLLQNFYTGKPASGVISDRVMFKATPSSPESPFAMGRVLLLRLDDGAKVWEGWSDASGYYTATGLDLGVEYIAVGIDPYRNHKATGAGPVVATEAAP